MGVLVIEISIRIIRDLQFVVVVPVNSGACAAVLLGCRLIINILGTLAYE